MKGDLILWNDFHQGIVNYKTDEKYFHHQSLWSYINGKLPKLYKAVKKSDYEKVK